MSKKECTKEECMNGDVDTPLTVAVMALDIASGDVDENLRRMEVMADMLPQGVDVAAVSYTHLTLPTT